MTEIFGTLGPACGDVETLVRMFENGMTGMRLNLSHTSLKESAEVISHFHEAASKAGVKPDLLCTVTSDTAENARAVYTALRKLDTGWIQFIPIVRRDINGNVTEDSVKPEQYGRFLKEIFREWITHDLGKLNVQIFAETSLELAGKPSNVCWFAETCGNVLVVEKDGSVYSCDHFVNRDHRLGNLN